jgi:outer membrane protein assembly factor BamB
MNILVLSVALVSIALVPVACVTMVEKWTVLAGDAVRGAAVASASGAVFFGSDDGFVYCIGDSGLQLWNYSTGSEVRQTPVLTDSTIVVGTFAGDVIALAADTGLPRWSRQLPGGGEVSAAPSASFDGKTVFFGTSSGLMFAIHVDSGSILWNFSTLAVVNDPACTDAMIIFGSNDGDVRALSAVTGQLLWRFSTPSFVKAAPLIVEQLVVIGCANGHVYAVSANNGSLVWDAALSTTSPVLTSPKAVGADYAVVGCNDGFVYALNSKNGSIAWQLFLGAPVLASAAVDSSQTVLAVSSTGMLFWINGQTGSALWRYNLTTLGAEFVTSAPAFDGNGVAVTFATDEGGLGAAALIVPFSTSVSPSQSTGEQGEGPASKLSTAVVVTGIVFLCVFAAIFSIFIWRLVRPFISRPSSLQLDQHFGQNLFLVSTVTYGAVLNTDESMRSIRL